MKKLGQRITTGIFILLLCAVPAGAQNTEEDQLKTSVQEINQIAQEPQGQQNIEQNLKLQFSVDKERIDALREQNLGYGEIGVTLSLAEQLPGGINDANINKVLNMRTAGAEKEWGQIAKELDTNLGQTINRIQNFSQNYKVGQRISEQPATDGMDVKKDQGTVK